MPWGLLDLALAVLVLLTLQGVALAILQRVLGVSVGEDFEDATAESRAYMLAAFSGASLATFVVSVAASRWRTAATIDDFGWSVKQIDRDLVVGFATAAMVVLPVFALQYVLTRVEETSHPIVEILKESPNPALFLLAGLAAVVVAPITEEYFFRVLLQGWLENIAAAFRWNRLDVPADDGLLSKVFLGGRWREERIAEFEPQVPNSPGLSDAEGTANVRLSAESVSESVAEPLADETLPAEKLANTDNPFATDGTTAPIPTAERLVSHQPTWWPIIASSALFAAAHIGNGPDPIPLFVLALGLGYVYQRTHRIWPCIMVHVIVNGISMLQLWVMVHTTQGK